MLVHISEHPARNRVRDRLSITVSRGDNHTDNIIKTSHALGQDVQLELVADWLIHLVEDCTAGVDLIQKIGK